MSKHNNVKHTLDANLCCSCGLCASYCKRGAIAYKIDRLGFYAPDVDKEKCNECGICLKSCPGINDLKNYDVLDEIFYYGWSCDSEMRLNASSGGVGTEFLCYLIKNKIVDYVTCVTNRTEKGNPAQILTNDIDVIRQSRTSKYCPVKWNETIKEIKRAEGNIAVIALPCQINSLKKYFSKKKHNIKFFISLLCNHIPSLYAAEYLAKGWDKRAKLLGIVNRGDGFPGVMTVDLAVGGLRYTVQSNYRQIVARGYGKYFKNRRCLMCNDPFGKNADMVMGDSYFLQDTDKTGTTFCIVRNEEIRGILSRMREDGTIHLEEGPEIDTINKYYKVLFERENTFCLKNSILKKTGCVPVNSKEKYDSKVSIRNFLSFYKSVFISSLGQYRILWRWLAKRNHLKEIIKIKK